MSTVGLRNGQSRQAVKVQSSADMASSYKAQTDTSGLWSCRRLRELLCVCRVYSISARQRVGQSFL